jgi:uncharacterized repeat protein (TIGR02543 family)
MNGGSVNASSGSAGSNHGVIVGALRITAGELSAVSGAVSGSNIYGLNASSITIDQGSGTLTASGGVRAITGALSLPGGYAYWRGTKADGSNANAYSFPENAAYSHNATYHYVKLQAREPHVLTVTGGLGSGSYFAGEVVQIRSEIRTTGIVSPTVMPPWAYPTESEVFAYWNGGGSRYVADANSAATTFRMPDADASIGVVTQTAHKLYLQSGYIIIGPNQSSSHSLGYYLPGTAVPLGSYSAPAAGYCFSGWSVVDASRTAPDGTVYIPPDYENAFTDANSAYTTFIMPSGNAIVRCDYVMVATEPYHTLTVVGGNIQEPDGTLLESGDYLPGTGRTIVADAPPIGKEFSRWKISVDEAPPAYQGAVTNIEGETTVFTMAEGNVTITAEYRDAIYSLDVKNGTGSGSYAYGASVAIRADALPGYAFSNWTLDDGSGSFADASSASTRFTMSKGNAIVTANYTFVGIPDGGGDDPGGGGGGVTTYQLRVEGGTLPNGSRTGQYAQGASVSISAGPVPTGQVFIGWTTDNGGGFRDASSTNTVFTMPGNSVTVTAHFAPPPPRVADVEHHVTVNNGFGSGDYKEGSVVTISADPRYGVSSWRDVPPGTGMPYFTGWTVIGNGIILENSSSATTSFTMPNTDVIIVANYNGFYSLVVINGTGTGLYAADEVVPIAATPRPSQGFIGWRSDYPGLAIANTQAQTTTVKMPADNVVVTAVVSGSGVSRTLNTDDHFLFVRGVGGGLFAPENSVTRAEVAQMFYNLLRDKNVPTTRTFPDVKAGSWYEPAVNALASLGIIKGKPGNRYAPGDPITRAEFVTIAARFADHLPDDGFRLAFTDVEESYWAYDYISTAYRYGWTRGSGGRFQPDRNISRAEVVVMINRMLDRAADRPFADAHSDLKRFSDVLPSHWAYYDIIEASNTHDYTRHNGDEFWTD